MNLRGDPENFKEAMFAFSTIGLPLLVFVNGLMWWILKFESPRPYSSSDFIQSALGMNVVIIGVPLLILLNVYPWRQHYWSFTDDGILIKRPLRKERKIKYCDVLGFGLGEQNIPNLALLTLTTKKGKETIQRIDRLTFLNITDIKAAYQALAQKKTQPVEDGQ